MGSQATRKPNTNIKEVEKKEETPVPAEAKQEMTELERDARKRLDMLTQQRDSAVNSLNQAITLSKQSEQQSFVLRGRISVFDEEIAEIRKRYDIKENVQ